MTQIDDINLCLNQYPAQSQDAVNCIRTVLGYQPITSTSSTSTTYIIPGKILILTGIVILGIYLLTKK